MVEILNWYEPQVGATTILDTGNTKTTSESIYIHLMPTTTLYGLGGFNETGG